ncbi:MAG: nucleotide exchange factor GrpE [Oscillospiraceae bacterium]|nr:nucleotide exchange factor GrpE [Oscillospiraceae bacterium]
MAKSKSTPGVKKEEKDAKSVNTKAGNRNVTEDSEMTEENVINEPGSKDLYQNELTAERDKYLRLAAEYDNFRKRSAKEREKTYTDARADVIGKLLPVYDNLERALKMECSDESYYKGVELIMTQLTDMLDSLGVKAIPAAGQPFDPNLHNAVMSIENPDLGENMVAEEIQKGFTLGDRVIRFSTVVVTK